MAAQIALRSVTSESSAASADQSCAFAIRGAWPLAGVPAAASAPAAFEGLPPAAELSGVSAMTSSNASTAMRSLCRQHSWPLNLDPGQNQFTISVSASQARS